MRPPLCPPGTLLDVASGPTPQTRAGGVGSGPTPQTRGGEGSCRPVTTIITGAGRRVDVGAWSAIALGIDGGSGSPELCRPLIQRPAVFGVNPGQTLAVGIHLTLTIPDQDLARLHAAVTGLASGARQLSLATKAAREVIDTAVATLLEPLRSLGGESSAAAVDISVTCEVARLAEGP